MNTTTSNMLGCDSIQLSDNKLRVGCQGGGGEKEDKEKEEGEEEVEEGVEEYLLATTLTISSEGTQIITTAVHILNFHISYIKGELNEMRTSLRP